MPKQKFTPPPPRLSKEMRQLWRRYVREYEMEPHQLKLLEASCRAWDTGKAARARAADDGEYFRDRWNQLKEHPGLKTFRDSMTLFARLCRELNFDPEPTYFADLPKPPKAKAVKQIQDKIFKN